jgi:hypothetical protein
MSELQRLKRVDEEAKEPKKTEKVREKEVDACEMGGDFPLTLARFPSPRRHSSSS